MAGRSSSAFIFTEAKLKADELLPAVRRALDRIGGALSEEDRGQIAGLMTEVEAAVSSGEAKRLQRANTALDEGTQRLATLLIEKAMAARSA